MNCFDRAGCRTTLLVVIWLLSSQAFADDAKQHSAVKPIPQKGERWKDRHERFNARVKKGNVDLIFIGDSITHAWAGDGKRVWEKFYGKRNAVNLGINSDRTQHVLWRLDHGNVNGISPKAAVLMIGTNNARENPPAETADGIKAIVAKLRKKLPKTKILVLAIFPRGKDKNDPFRRQNIKTNAIIKNFADEKMVFYLDIGEEFMTDDGRLPSKIVPDLVHLSHDGFEIWARSIEPSLKKLMAEN